MSFWSLSDNKSAADTGGSFEIPTGGDLIPNDSSVLASIVDAKWATDQNGNEYLNLRWSVLQPEQLAGRSFFQKLWVTDDEPRAKDPAKKRDKALKMFAAIDANAGGKLARKDGKPTDDDLALALMNKPMVVKVMVYDMTATGGPVGNWVAAVNPKGGSLKVGNEPAPQKQQQARRDDVTPGGQRDFAPRGGYDDSEIPF